APPSKTTTTRPRCRSGNSRPNYRVRWLSLGCARLDLLRRDPLRRRRKHGEVLLFSAQPAPMCLAKSQRVEFAEQQLARRAVDLSCLIEIDDRDPRARAQRRQ